MQLPLSFEQEPSSQTESSPDVWMTLDAERRSEALAVLVRVLAKAATENTKSNTAEEQEENRHD